MQDRILDLRRIGRSRDIIETNITTDETTDWVPIGPYGFNEVTLFPNFSVIATANASDQIDFYFQTKTDDEVIYDLLNIHFATAHNGNTHAQPRLWRGGGIGGFRSLAVTDGTIDDDETQMGVSLGTHVRMKVVFTIVGTPTLTYSCKALFRHSDQGMALPPGKGIDIDTGVTRTIKRKDYELAATSGATQMLAGVSSRKIRVIEMDLHTDVAGNITIQDDNGSPQKLTGAMEFVAGGQWKYDPSVSYPGEKYLGETQSGDDLDADIENASTVGGYFNYLEI